MASTSRDRTGQLPSYVYWPSEPPPYEYATYNTPPSDDPFADRSAYDSAYRALVYDGPPSPEPPSFATTPSGSTRPDKCPDDSFDPEFLRSLQRGLQHLQRQQWNLVSVVKLARFLTRRSRKDNWVVRHRGPGDTGWKYSLRRFMAKDWASLRGLPTYCAKKEYVPRFETVALVSNVKVTGAPAVIWLSERVRRFEIDEEDESEDERNENALEDGIEEDDNEGNSVEEQTMEEEESQRDFDGAGQREDDENSWTEPNSNDLMSSNRSNVEFESEDDSESDEQENDEDEAWSEASLDHQLENSDASREGIHYTMDQQPSAGWSFPGRVVDKLRGFVDDKTFRAFCLQLSDEHCTKLEGWLDQEYRARETMADLSRCGSEYQIAAGRRLRQTSDFIADRRKSVERWHSLYALELEREIDENDICQRNLAGRPQTAEMTEFRSHQALRVHKAAFIYLVESNKLHMDQKIRLDERTLEQIEELYGIVAGELHRLRS